MQSTMSDNQTTDEAFLRTCEVLGIQASRFSYLDAAAIRADRDRLRDGMSLHPITSDRARRITSRNEGTPAVTETTADLAYL